MKSIAFHNLGCKVNSYEIDVMQQMSQNYNYEIVQFEQKADVYVINTCSVTNIADRKSRQMIHKAKKQNPNSVVVAVGCYVQTDMQGVAEDACVDLMIGNNHKKELFEILERYFESRSTQQSSKEEASSDANTATDTESITDELLNKKTLGKTTVSDLIHADYEEVKMSQTADHTRAYIKIQDGCNRFCSYCVIPYARGRVRSRLPENVIEEIQMLVEKGYKEFVFTGIHVSSYGLDLVGENNGTYLLSLLERVQAVEGVKRIRLSSLEPMIITPEFAKGLACLTKLCPHFHLSLQSGCDATLKRMNRRYTSGEYYDRVQILREYFSNAAITTDVIVGFPGETEEEFDETTAFLNKVQFYEMHVFKYSKRKGTKAAVMPCQVREEIKAQRSDVLLAMTQRHSEEFRQSHLGECTKALLEEVHNYGGKNYWIGYTPEYIRVAVSSNENLSNTIIDGQLSQFLDEDTSHMTLLLKPNRVE